MQTYRWIWQQIKYNQWTVTDKFSNNLDWSKGVYMVSQAEDIKLTITFTTVLKSYQNNKIVNQKYKCVWFFWIFVHRKCQKTWTLSRKESKESLK